MTSGVERVPLNTFQPRGAHRHRWAGFGPGRNRDFQNPASRTWVSLLPPPHPTQLRRDAGRDPGGFLQPVPRGAP